jgi:glucose dehydrogenase
VTLLATLLAILMTPPPEVLAKRWQRWGGTPGGSKYSALNQINRNNVTDIEIARTRRTGDFEGDMARSGKITGGLKANK